MINYRHRNYVPGNVIFNINEINNIKEYLDQLDKLPGKLYGQESEEKELVDYIGSRVHLNDDIKWVYDRVYESVVKLNDESYQYDITGISEQMYYNTFDAALDHHFNWHVDSGVGNPYPRKITAVIQLSDPSEYEGGVLEIKAPNSDVKVSNTLGSIAIFPSYRIHRVTPVTKGLRNTLVAFITGPEFR